MQQIPLTQVPNQTVAFNTDDGAYWQLHIFQAITMVCADVTRNGVPIIQGVRCFGGIALMPYEYMYEPNFGNFIFDEDADWTEFGQACNLYYLNNAEYQEYKAMSILG